MSVPIENCSPEQLAWLERASREELVYVQLVGILVELFEVSEQVITPETDFDNDLLGDSLDNVEFAEAIEDEIPEIRLEDNEINDIRRTVAQTHRLIMRKFFEKEYPEIFEKTPYDEAFRREILAPLDADMMDSLDYIELVDDDSIDDEAAAKIVTAVAELPDAERRHTVLRRNLQMGEEFETTMYGLPIMIIPINKKPQPPRPDEAGDREPREPILPHLSGRETSETLPESQVVAQPVA